MHFYLRDMHYNTVTNHYHIFILRFMENMTKTHNYSNYITDKNNKNEYNYSNNSNSSIDTDNQKDNACVVGCTVDIVVSVTVTLALSVIIIMMIFLLQWIRDRKNGMLCIKIRLSSTKALSTLQHAWWLTGHCHSCMRCHKRMEENKSVKKK